MFLGLVFELGGCLFDFDVPMEDVDSLMAIASVTIHHSRGSTSGQQGRVQGRMTVVDGSNVSFLLHRQRDESVTE